MKITENEQIENEQIENAKNRLGIMGVHVSPVKKGRKCVNKKTRMYSKNVTFQGSPEYLENLRLRLNEKNRVG